MVGFFQTEYNYFQKLGKNAQALFVSSMLSGFADPALYLFLTAFLYRQTHSLIPIGIYYSGFYIGLPIGFLINGRLLHIFTSQILYWIGCIIEGLIILTIAWMSMHGLLPVWFFGCIFGIGAGLYWANRNFLTLTTIDAEKRMYYGNLESGIGTLISIIAPAMIGGFIAVTSSLFLIPLFAYKLVAFFAFLILAVTGYLLQRMDQVSHSIPKHFVTKSSSKWLYLRLFMVSNGLFSGIIIFLPTLIIFTFLGKEGTLGTIQAVVSLLSAGVVLFLAKRVHSMHAYLFLIISIALSITATLLFGIFFSAIGALLFFLFDAFSQPFSWAPYNTISFNTIDIEQKLFGFHHYNYVVDQEIFLNLGRLIAIGIFLSLVVFGGPLISLRLSPIFLSLLQISQVFIAWKLIQ